MQGRSPWPAWTQRSSSSLAQLSFAGNCRSGESKTNSGCSSRGGRCSAAKVSTWAELIGNPPRCCALRNSPWGRPGGSSLGSACGAQQFARDEELLHFTGSFVDAQGANLAIQALDRLAAANAAPAEH